MYTNWHDGRKPGAPWTTCSPNLRQILDYCSKRWGLTNLGCYGVRPIRGGTRWSAHAFGAAQDMSYRNGPTREVIVDEVIPFLEAHAAQLGIQRIHDYMGRRYWQAGKGWIGRPPGGVNDHIHVETTAEAWADDRSVEERIGTSGPIPTAPKPSGWQPIRLGDSGDKVRMVQQVLADKGYKNSSGRRPILVDGEFGPTTDKRVRQYQKDNGLVSDGIVGPITAGHMGLA
ncbi:MAG TPA: peptidoglycan-binding domain-containing protein [Acidimicrobiia bacterium]